MELALAPLIGFLVAVAAWLMLTGNLIRFLFGLILVSNGVNLALFAVGRLTYAAPPLIPEGAVAASGAANALPQALILTAIVISFGLLCVALALVHRAYAVFGTVEGDALRAAEPADGRD